MEGTDDAERFAADAAVHESALERGRRRGLRRSAEADATLRGALIDLAERVASVAVSTPWGSTHAGIVVAVGDDVVTVEGPAGLAMVRLDAVATVRTVEPSGAPTARPDITGPASLAGVLADLAEEGERAQLRCGAVAPVVGRLVAVGLDVVTVQPDHGPPVVVALPAVTEALVPRGGVA